MSARSRRSPRRSRGSAARTVVGLLALGALAAVGFGAGVVAGVFAEEPELVVGHLAGRSREVHWSAGEDDLPDVAAPPGDGAAGPPGAKAAPAADVAGPPRPDAGSGAADAPGDWRVQVGAFAASEPAEALAATLRSKGYPVVVTPGVRSKDARWRVRVGPVTTRAEADRLAGRLKSEEGLPTWVLGEAGG